MGSPEAETGIPVHVVYCTERKVKWEGSSPHRCIIEPVTTVGNWN